MGVLEWIVTSLNFLLVSLSLAAAITARSALRQLRQRLAARSSRSLRELDAQVASLELALASTTTSVRRLSSKIGMRDVRERQKEESANQPPPNLTPAEVKIWLRKNLQAGKLRVIRDGAATSAD